jgi:hypothetical protein
LKLQHSSPEELIDPAKEEKKQEPMGQRLWRRPILQNLLANTATFQLNMA